MEAIVYVFVLQRTVSRQVFSQRASDEWLANIDPSLLDIKSNEEKQLDDSEISSFITATQQLKKKLTFIMFGHAGATP